MNKLLIQHFLFLFLIVFVSTNASEIAVENDDNKTIENTKTFSSFVQSIYDNYGEYNSDLFTLIQSTLMPDQVYLEIQDNSPPYDLHLPPLIQHLNQGAVVLLSNNNYCENIVSKYNHSKFYCLNGILSEISQQGFTMNSLIPFLKNSVPAFIKFSHNNGLFLHNSELLKLQSSLFYVRNEMNINTILML